MSVNVLTIRNRFVKVNICFSLHHGSLTLSPSLPLSPPLSRLSSTHPHTHTHTPKYSDKHVQNLRVREIDEEESLIKIKKQNTNKITNI